MPKNTPQVTNFRVEEHDNHAEIFLYGYIGEDYWMHYSEGENPDKQNTDISFVSELARLEKDYKIINIRINSPGGEMYHGNPMVNAIQNSSAQIHTYNDGMVASMAFTIYMSAPNRHWKGAGLAMSHKPSAYSWGNVDDMYGTIEMLDAFEETSVDVISNQLSITKKKAKDTFFTSSDKWISRDEALELGLITHKEKAKSNKASSVKNMMGMPYNDLIKQFKITNSSNMKEVLMSLVALIKDKTGLDFDISNDATDEGIVETVSNALTDMTSIEDQISTAVTDAVTPLNEQIATLEASTTEEPTNEEQPAAEPSATEEPAADEAVSNVQLLAAITSMNKKVATIEQANTKLAAENKALAGIINDSITKDTELNQGGVAGNARSAIEDTKNELKNIGSAEGESKYS